MPRTASTVCLCAWTTFLIVGAFRLLAEAQLFGALQDRMNGILELVRQGDALGVSASSAEVYAVLLIALAIVLMGAVIRLNSQFRSASIAGERAAMGALAALFAFWLSATVAGSEVAPLFGSGTAFCFALAATFGALLFDHAMTADESESDEAFAQVMAELERAQARHEGRAHRQFDERGDY
ncbi:hypothetical protein DYI37_02905 [Fulvimarina endophytica]|uniref:Uncharacterized protein n=1 Tax=Fulvimarina endophytica TaxID=2293836 RepID=A0A371XAZ1_9HYPH|nr:hypothetical protein [Fulvimarina endophytica]RFC66408.1 hypothetical protein DYI37_02905 [Fulvimarina endophytica]